MSTILTEVSTFTPTVICPNPGEPIKASDTIGVTYLIPGVDFNGGVLYVGLNPNVRVRHLGGMSMALAVTVLGNDITIQLATDASGNVLSTANQVVIAFNLVVAATTRATATAQGTGASIAGIFTNFMKIGDDAFGSIRPGFQSFANRTRYLFDKLIAIIFGTRTLKSLKVDGIGDVATASSAGDIEASRDIESGRDISSTRDIFSGRDTVSQRHITSNTGNISALSGNIQSVTGELIGQSLQLNDTGGGTMVPTPTIPINNFYQDMLPVALARIDSVGSLIYGVNINSITHPGIGQYTIVLNVSLTYVTNIQITAKTLLPFAVGSVSCGTYDITSVSPVTIDIDLGPVGLGGGTVDREFCILIYGV